MKLSACPLKTLAGERGIPALSPPDVNSADSVAAIRDLSPDLIVVAAYGQILKPELLALPPQGCVNVHPSLLPRYRGAAPIPWAMANGDRVTGVTIIHMAKRMDAGDIILQERVNIEPEDTGGALHDKLAAVGAALLAKAVDAIAQGRAARMPQAESDATYAPKLTKEDGRMDWTKPATELHNRVRAFNPWPCCHCAIPGRGALRVLKTAVEAAVGQPGEVLDVTGAGPVIAAGSGSLRLLEVQPEGGKIMTGSAYQNGHALGKGDHLL